MSSHIEKRSQTFKVRDTDVTILADACVDDKTNEIVFDRQLDNEAINMAFEQYRTNNNIVGYKDIVEFRKKYNLSQRALAKLLGIGSATVARYEKGALPTDSLSNLLKEIMNDDGSFVSFFEKNKSNLSDDDKKKVESVLVDVKQKIKTNSVLKAYILRNDNNQANVAVKELPTESVYV